LIMYMLTSVLAADKVRLAEVRVLTLQEGRFTTGKRSHSVPQLSCKGHLCSEWTPKSVLCTNMGTDGRDVQWKCESDMPGGIRFGTVDVSCEGYNYPDDDFILVGSCGLTYTLEGRSHERTPEYNSPYKDAYGSYSSYSKTTWSFGTLLSWAAIALVFFAIYRAWKHNAGGGYNGGPHGGHNPWGPGAGPSAPPSYGESCPPPPYTAPAQGGGFWSGMLGGGALGYMLGNRGNHGAGYQYHQAPGFRSGGGFGGGRAASPGHRDSGGVRTAYGGTSRR